MQKLGQQQMQKLVQSWLLEWTLLHQMEPQKLQQMVSMQRKPLWELLQLQGLGRCCWTVLQQKMLAQSQTKVLLMQQLATQKMRAQSQLKVLLMQHLATQKMLA